MPPKHPAAGDRLRSLNLTDLSSGDPACSESGEIVVRSVKFLIIASALFSSAATAADYRDAYPRRHRTHAHYALPAPAFRQVPPTYYVDAPPRYIQDVRTGEPGYWVDNRRTLLDQIFGNYY
jgi:hypothetical protein